MEAGDEAVARRFPRQWARANDPSLPGRSKARNNLRRMCRHAEALDAFIAANPSARCWNCTNAMVDPTVGIKGTACAADSDFHGYAMIADPGVHVCARWEAAPLSPEGNPHG